MKVLFLDVDGVINTQLSMVLAVHEGIHPPGNARPHTVDRSCVARLRDVVMGTGARIVVSSSWRLYPDAGILPRALAWAGWPDAPIIGQTPDGADLYPKTMRWPKRGDEIAAWLAAHPEVTQFAIVDDDADMLPEQMPRLVHTC